MSTIQKLKMPNDSGCRKGFCDYVKLVLLKIFLITRYYLDIFIDCVFGYFNDSKRVPIKKCTNPIILESAVSLAQKIRKRVLTSEEVVQAFVNRIKEVNPVLNALVDSRYEAALEDARKIDRDIANGTIVDADFQEKPFLGIPFTTKESTAVEGLSFTMGIIKRKGKKALFDADYVTLLKNAGAICLGVTNIPQLNLWQETHNPVYGITNNPYNTTRNVGGSSGGEASLLAAGGTSISIGTDIGGSVRIPGFMCGVFAHKPTSHLIPIKGTMYKACNADKTLVVISLLTRSTEDLTPLLKVLVKRNAFKLKLDNPVNIKNIKIYYITNPKDISVSPIRDEMKVSLQRLGTEKQTIVTVGILSRHAVDISPLLKVLADEHASKLKLDQPVTVKNVKICYVKDPEDILVSPTRGEMTEIFNRYGVGFRTGEERVTMLDVGPLTKYTEELSPLLKILLAENGKKLRLDDPVDVRNIKISYILNPEDPLVSSMRKIMKKTMLRAVNHFDEISATKPEEVKFEGTKYAGKLWKYWMGKEDGVNFMKDITDRTGEAHPLIDTIKHFTVGSEYSMSTIFNFINKLLPYPDEKWAVRETEKLREQILARLGDNGVLLYPSAPFPASYHHASYLRPWNFHFFVIWNVLKFPVTQVPLGLSNGLPLGIQVVAAPYQDHLCIAVAKELERAFGGYVPPFETA